MYKYLLDTARETDARKKAEGYRIIDPDEAYPIIRVFTTPLYLFLGLFQRLVLRIFPSTKAWL